MRFRTPLPSNFETIFSDLVSSAVETGDAPGPPHPISIGSLEAAWDIAAQARVMPESVHLNRTTGAQVYGEEGTDVRDISLDPQSILSELGLLAGSTEAEIATLRREFALRNHPDRVPLELRDLATQRMMLANDLIDSHLARLRRSTR